MNYTLYKRVLDFLFSLILILLLLPVFIISAFLILIFMGQPMLFVQYRIGLNNKEFRIYKFRTMFEKSDKRKTDKERITVFGRLLRISRVDELPQLLNILLGDMSFIGPRPLLPDYLPYYTENELQRHTVRPGLSGLSQVSLSYPDWEEQFLLDIKYAENLNLISDVQILIKTISKVLKPTKKLVSGNAGRERFDVHRQSQQNII